MPLLLGFIRDHRFSLNDDVKTAVGAAIRKLAMNLSYSLLEDYADLLKPTDTETLPAEIELELTKAILWRLSVTEARASGTFPNLELRLYEIAGDYLRPRLILQRNHAAIALNAVLASLVLPSQYDAALVTMVAQLGMPWFLDQFRRRLTQLCEEVRSRNHCEAERVCQIADSLQPSSQLAGVNTCQHGA